MKAISEKTCERAWLAAVEHLASVPEQTEYNLVVEIEKPAHHDAEDHRVRDLVDRFLRSHGAKPLSTVAGTIFPAAEYLNHGSRGVYEYYPEEVYPTIRSKWGTYAYRLVRWPDPRGKKSTLIPLQTVVDKIKKQLKNGQRFRACYELSLSDSAIDLPLYDPISDALLPRGGPCLSHISLKLGAEDILYLTALYRSHTYIGRALGNFLGLAALQAFICDQTDLGPGPLVCVSTYARIEPDKGWTTGAALELVQSARRALNGE